VSTGAEGMFRYVCSDGPPRQSAGTRRGGVARQRGGGRT
jgi:hypothetical protein